MVNLQMKEDIIRIWKGPKEDILLREDKLVSQFKLMVNLQMKEDILCIWKGQKEDLLLREDKQVSQVITHFVP